MSDEAPFRPFYHPDNGRPNVPPGTLIVTFKALALNIKRHIESERAKAAKAKAVGAHRLHIAISGVPARILGSFPGRPFAHAACTRAERAKAAISDSVLTMESKLSFVIN